MSDVTCRTVLRYNKEKIALEHIGNREDYGKAKNEVYVRCDGIGGFRKNCLRYQHTMLKTDSGEKSP